MLMDSLEYVLNALYNFEIFGIKPIRGILTMFSGGGTWAVIIGLIVISFIVNFLVKAHFFALIKMCIQYSLNGIKNIFKGITFVICQSYMMILFNIDSKKNNYNKYEYWNSRKMTLEGIKATGLTGAEEVLIPHMFIVKMIVLQYCKTIRALNNIKIYCFNKVKE